VLSPLQSLNLGLNDFQTDSVTVLCRHLAALLSLHSLNLGYNELQADGAAALGPHLAALSSLKSLSPSKNYFPTDGAAALGPLLVLSLCSEALLHLHIPMSSFLDACHLGMEPAVAGFFLNINLLQLRVC
jgi:hypothetical protein